MPRESGDAERPAGARRGLYGELVGMFRRAKRTSLRKDLIRRQRLMPAIASGCSSIGEDRFAAKPEDASPRLCIRDASGYGSHKQEGAASLRLHGAPVQSDAGLRITSRVAQPPINSSAHPSLIQAQHLRTPYHRAHQTPHLPRARMYRIHSVIRRVQTQTTAFPCRAVW